MEYTLESTREFELLSELVLEGRLIRGTNINHTYWALPEVPVTYNPSGINLKIKK